jgi:hypothetical protein
LSYGYLLASFLEYQYPLAAQIEAGTKKAILITGEGKKEVISLQLAALGTISLRKAMDIGVPALHVEAKPRFRIPADKSNSLTHDGAILGQGIAKSFLEYSR